MAGHSGSFFVRIDFDLDLDLGPDIGFDLGLDFDFDLDIDLSLNFDITIRKSRNTLYEQFLKKCCRGMPLVYTLSKTVYKVYKNLKYV